MVADKKAEVKKDNFKTVEEALKGAGSRVLSYLEQRAHILTQKEVKENDEKLNPKDAPTTYGGPYEDEDDQRNSWIYVQETPPPAPPPGTKSGAVRGD